MPGTTQMIFVRNSKIDTAITSMQRKLPILFFIFFILGLGYFAVRDQGKPSPVELKLYWFIPDGFRAEPDLFNIYQWAEEGKLPNIKKLMDMLNYL